MRAADSESSRRSRRLFVALGGAVLAGSVAGCAGTKAREYVDDSAITSKIKAEFATDKTVSALDIHVTTTMGHVRLSGVAKSGAEKLRAGHIARSVSGVASVANDIKVKGD
ncbi:MAG: BON domain-containing protein [Betaproteobacteria bacterium]|nr:BON domain-containing protein [Betaproteobacteria bacterium]